MCTLSLDKTFVPLLGKTDALMDSCYLPGHGMIQVHDSVPTSVFFDEFTVYLEDVVMCPEVLGIASDFNLHIDDPENADTRRFFELLETFGLVQHVNFSTHVSGHWLDLNNPFV